jgi:hypothetical protein
MLAFRGHLMQSPNKTAVGREAVVGVGTPICLHLTQSGHVLTTLLVAGNCKKA